MGLGPLLFSVEFPLLALSTTFVALRFYCRSVIIRKLGTDDWLILISLLHVWGIAILNVFQVRFGTGTHMKDLSPLEAIFIGALKTWYIYQILYLVSLYWIKLSILAFYRRLSPAQGFHTSVKTTAAVVTVFTVAMIFVNAFECPGRPSLAWATSFPKGCNNLVPVYYAQAAFNIFSDIVILVLPLPSLLKLHVNRPKRIALILVFSIGGIAVIASIVRINALYRFQESSDISYDGIYILLWSAIELNVAIVSASAPALRPFFKSIIGGSSAAKSGYPGGSGYSGPQQHQFVRNNRIPMQTFSGPGRDAEITTNVSGRDINESEENIVMKTGILRTTDVRVEIMGDGRSDGARSTTDEESVRQYSPYR